MHATVSRVGGTLQPSNNTSGCTPPKRQATPNTSRARMQVSPWPGQRTTRVTRRGGRLMLYTDHPALEYECNLCPARVAGASGSRDAGRTHAHRCDPRASPCFSKCKCHGSLRGARRVSCGAAAAICHLRAAPHLKPIVIFALAAVAGIGDDASRMNMNTRLACVCADPSFASVTAVCECHRSLCSARRVSRGASAAACDRM